MSKKPAAPATKKGPAKPKIFSELEAENPKVSDVHILGPLIASQSGFCITLSRDPSYLPLTEESQARLLGDLKLKKLLATPWLSSETHALTTRANILGLGATFHPGVYRWRVAAEDIWLTEEQFLKRIDKARKALLGIFFLTFLSKKKETNNRL
jgi:hypothetical protein